MALPLLITGIILVVLAAIVGVINMGFFVRNEFRNYPRGGWDEDEGDFGSMFTRQVFAAVVAIIGLGFIAGGILVMVSA